VNASALNKQSIPESGEIGLQYPDVHGVCNVAFPITMQTYNYSEAPAFLEDVPCLPIQTMTLQPTPSHPLTQVANKLYTFTYIE
jgi:hypothetical protein